MYLLGVRGAYRSLLVGTGVSNRGTESTIKSASSFLLFFEYPMRPCFFAVSCNSLIDIVCLSDKISGKILCFLSFSSISTFSSFLSLLIFSALCFFYYKKFKKNSIRGIFSGQILTLTKLNSSKICRFISTTNP